MGPAGSQRCYYGPLGQLMEEKTWLAVSVQEAITGGYNPRNTVECFKLNCKIRSRRTRDPSSHELTSSPPCTAVLIYAEFLRTLLLASFSPGRF